MGGSFTIGTEAEPFLQRAVVTLHGSPVSKEIPLYGSKVLGCRSCTLDLHGKPVLRTWTNLLHTALAGDNQIWLQDPVDWEAGAALVLTSTAANGTMEEAETVIVAHVSEGGRQLLLVGRLEYTHLGETFHLAGDCPVVHARIAC